MAMPAQLNQVAKAMGTTTDKLGEDLRNGKVSMNDFIDTFIRLNKEGVDGFQSFEQQAKNSTGGIRTSIQNAKTAVTRGVADIVTNINEGLKGAGIEGGIGEIVGKIGSTFEEVLKKVGSKIKEILPPIIDFIKNTIDKVRKWLSDIDFKTLWDNVKKTIKIIKDIMTEALKPIFNFIKDQILPKIKELLKFLSTKFSTTDWDKFKKTLQNLAPVINAVLVGLLAFKTVSTISTIITNISTAFTKLKTTLTSTTGVIGLAVAGITTFIIAVKTLADSWYKSFKDSDEKMRASVSNIGKAFDEYGQKIDSATSKTDAFGRQLFITAEEDQKIQDEMKNIQESITNITYKAHEERRELSQGEIDKVEEYLQKLEELSGKYLEVTQKQGDAIKEQALTSFESVGEGFDAFADNYTSWAKTLKENEESATKTINDNTTQRITLLNAEWENRDKNTDEYKNAYNEIIESGNQRVESVKSNTREVMELAENELQHRLGINEEELHSIADMAIERKDALDRVQQAQDSAYAIDKISALNHWNEKKDIYEQNNKQISEIMNNGTAEQLGIWAKSLEESAKYGGEITLQDLQMAEDIMKIYESLDEDSKNKMSNMYESLKNISKSATPQIEKEAKNLSDKVKQAFSNMKKDGEDAGNNLFAGLNIALDRNKGSLLSKIGYIATQTIERFKAGLQEASPSKATYEMGIFFLKGFENAIDKEKATTLRNIDNLGDEIVNKMSNAVDVENAKISAKAIMTGNINRTIQINADFKGNVELDNRKVGRIIAPNVAQTIKAGGLA